MRTKSLIAGCAALLAAGGALAAAVVPSAPSAASTRPRTLYTVEAGGVGSFGTVLISASGHSLYLLERNNRPIWCPTGPCTGLWPPLTVARGTHITKGPGVRGKIGLVTRGSREQVTFNNFPVYHYAGDNGPRQSHGEGIQFGGGAVWYLIRASATTAAGSPVK